MYSNNQNVSANQIKKLLIFDILSVSIIILPEIAAVGAGRDGLIAIILGTLAAVFYGLFFLYAANNVGENYMDFSKKAIGKFLTFIMGILYIVKLLFSCWFALSLFSKVINDTLLPDTNVNLIIALLILVSAYAAEKGIEVRARLVEVLFFMVIVPLVFLVALGFRRVDITNLLPLLTENSNNVLRTSYGVLLTFQAVELIIFAAPRFSDKADRQNRKTSVIRSVLFAGAINAALFVLVVGLLGLAGAKHHLKSSIMIMQLIQIPGGIVQRQDAIMLTIWMMSIFAILSAYFYYLTEITDNLIRIKKPRYYLLFWVVLLFIISFVKIPMEQLFSYYGKYMAYVGLPQSIVIPLFVIIISKLRSQGGKANENK